MLLLELAVLLAGAGILLWGAGSLLKSLDIKVRRKPAPLSEVEEEALREQIKANKMLTEGMSGIMNYGLGGEMK